MKQKQKDNITITLSDYESNLDYYIGKLRDSLRKVDYYTYRIKLTKSKIKLLKVHLEWR